MSIHNEAGETAAQISKRSDDETWPRVMQALQDGAFLHIHTKIRRAAVEGLPESDPRCGRVGTLSASRVKTLQKKGILREFSLDKYVLTEFGLQEQIQWKA